MTPLQKALKVVPVRINTVVNGLDSSGSHNHNDWIENPDVTLIKTMCHGGATNHQIIHTEKGEDFWNIVLAFEQGENMTEEEFWSHWVVSPYFQEVISA